MGTYGALLLFCLLNDIRSRRRQERLIGRIAPKITPGIPARYEGIYSVGFEMEGVSIATGRRRFFVFPIIESWEVHFPPKTELPGFDFGKFEVMRYRLRFIGTPGQPGGYGHMGTNRRAVDIHLVLSIELLDSE